MIVLTNPSLAGQAERCVKDVDLVLKISSKNKEQTLKSYWDNVLVPRCREARAVVGFGSGLVMDVAKYVSSVAGSDLILKPTCLSTDAMFTSTTAVREEKNGKHVVRYIKTRKADKIDLDFELIMRSNERLNASGWGDVLSIFTGTLDWRFSGESNYDLMIVDEMMRLVKLAEKPTSYGALKMLADCLRKEVEMCDSINTSRPEEGSEHLFAYYCENFVSSYLHGELVSLGMLLMSTLHDVDIYEPLSYVQRAGIDLSLLLRELDVERMKEVLHGLKDYVVSNGYFKTVIHELDSSKIEKLLDAYVLLRREWVI